METNSFQYCTNFYSPLYNIACAVMYNVNNFTFSQIWDEMSICRAVYRSHNCWYIIIFFFFSISVADRFLGSQQIPETDHFGRFRVDGRSNRSISHVPTGHDTSEISIPGFGRTPVHGDLERRCYDISNGELIYTTSLFFFFLEVFVLDFFL